MQTNIEHTFEEQRLWNSEQSQNFYNSKNLIEGLETQLPLNILRCSPPYFTLVHSPKMIS